MKKIFIKCLKSFSRIINHIIPEELGNNNLINPSGVYKLLIEENDKLTYEILGADFKKSIPFDDRTLTRKYAIDLALSNQQNISKREELFYLEFGVWKGNSANFFSKYVEKLYVFDSFQGLKEEWTGMLKKGAFNLNKKIPRLNKNVIPTVGWVEDTIDNFLKKYNPKINFVHFDMDLYSPTLYTLQKIKPYLIDGAIILFDEFYNYLDWENGEYKALTEVFNKSEYEYKGYTINSKEVFIKIKNSRSKNQEQIKT